MSMANDLHERVRLESPLYDNDAYGGADISWQLVGEYFAHVVPAGNQTQRAGGQVEHTPQYRVTLRAPRALTNEMRFIWRDMVLAIDTVIAQPRSIEITYIRCAYE